MKMKWPLKKQNLIPNPCKWISPIGFIVNGVASGVKKRKAADISIVLSTCFPVNASAVFTKNAFCAAPVLVCKDIVTSSSAGVLGVVVNSGCANACTGLQGLADAKEMAAHLPSTSRDWMAKNPKTKSSSTTTQSTTTHCLVMSTGVIGQKLQMEKIKSGLIEAASSASDSFEHWMASAEGIMTTDTFPKLRAKEFKSSINPSVSYRMAGWSKGAGMIHPNMATMLSSVFTDCAISKSSLDKACTFAADRSFNAISIDGDTSTNDTFFVLANAASPSMKSTTIDYKKTPELYNEFQNNLTEFAKELAKLIVRDGEGATKFVQVTVTGASSIKDAKQVAATIVKSPLVKTAIYGKDANWGRIVCAVGYSGIDDITPSKVNLWFGTLNKSKMLHLFKDGEPFDINEEVASKILEEEDLIVHVDLGKGKEKFDMYTCDMSHEYISINADYRS